MVVVVVVAYLNGYEKVRRGYLASPLPIWDLSRGIAKPFWSGVGVDRIEFGYCNPED